MKIQRPSSLLNSRPTICRRLVYQPDKHEKYLAIRNLYINGEKSIITIENFKVGTFN